LSEIIIFENMKYLLILLLPSILTSCIVLNSGNVSSGPLLDVKDKYRETARGEAHSILYLMLLGPQKNDLLLKAKRNMYQNRPLQAGEYYANFTGDLSKTIYLFGLIVVTKAIVSAEVIQSTSNSAQDEQNKDSSHFFKVSLNISSKGDFVYKTDTFRLGEKVYYKEGRAEFQQYTIRAIKANKVELAREDNTRVLFVSLFEELFSRDKSLYRLHAGDKVILPYPNEAGMATILGVSGNRYLVKYEDRYLIFSPSQVRKPSYPGKSPN